MRPIRYSITVLIALAIAPDPLVSGPCDRVVEWAMGYVRSLWSTGPNMQVILQAQQRVRNVLGDIVPEKINTEVSFITCLREPGCRYNAVFDVIQLDEKGVLKNQMAMSVIYAHELGHAIQENQIAKTLKIRDELSFLKRKYLNTYSRFYSVYNALNSVGFWGQFLFFTNADSRAYDKILKLESEIEQLHAESNKNSSDEVPSKDERFTTEQLLHNAAGEVFADLLSCAAHKDGAAMTKAIGQMWWVPPDTLRNRVNSEFVDIKDLLQWQSIDNIDSHELLTFARRSIWRKYLANQDVTAVRQALSVLNDVTLQWPDSVSVNKNTRSVAQRDEIVIDVWKLNFDFLAYFEQQFVKIQGRIFQ